jgi:CDP-paratose 2-epimerase
MTMPVDSSAKRVLVTGGCGFVGSNVAVALASRWPDWDVVALDNLNRRGSELNLPRLREAGVEFMHGDVRELADLTRMDPVDAIVECSAEPSALAGIADGSTSYVVRTNLLGAYHCLELARRDNAQLIFLSTSRVYPIDRLNDLVYSEAETRFELAAEQSAPGASVDGIAESFPLDGARTLYGATKLAAELLIEEYARAFQLRTVVNRCGVVAGPWQMGHAEQGVFAHWLLAHYFRRPLRYIGFGGGGKQVRDVVHVDDLVDLLVDQLFRPEHWAGVTANVGGGSASTLSLLETTEICRELTGHRVNIGRSAETRPGDVAIYISNCRLVTAHGDWRPQRSAADVLASMFEWIRENERVLRAAG